MNKWLRNNLSIIVFFMLVLFLGIIQLLCFGGMHLIGFALIGGFGTLFVATLIKLAIYVNILCEKIADAILDSLDINED